LSVEQLLEFGDFPFADKLLQSIRSQREQAEHGRMPEGAVASAELQQQIASQASPQAMQSLNRYLGAA
jgi:allophanate hydrolase subunit 1